MLQIIQNICYFYLPFIELYSVDNFNFSPLGYQRYLQTLQSLLLTASKLDKNIVEMLIANQMYVSTSI